MPEKKVKTTTNKSKIEKKPVLKKAESTKQSVKSTAKEAKPIAEKTETKKATDVVHVGLKLDIVNTKGEKDGTMTLPEKIFGAKKNSQLIAQAVRIYLTNQRQGTVSTKTRGEVDGSTRKIYRQKGTGRARHGGIRAPIFVKGGIAHGPKPKEYALHLPKKMKRAALFSALSGKLKDGEIKIVTGLESLETKTKAFAGAFEKWGLQTKGRNVLFVLPKDIENMYKSARNLAGVTITTANRLNTYEILQHKVVVFVKDAVETLEKTFTHTEEK